MQSERMAGVPFLPLYFGSSGGLGGITGSCWVASAPSTADYLFGCLDRQRLGRQYNSAKAVIPWQSVVQDATRFVFNIGLQDAPGASGPWADVAGSIIGSTGTRKQVIQGPTVTSSAGWTYGAVGADFNLMAARRYVRFAYNVDAVQATSSGPQLLPGTPVMLLGGPSEIPVDSNFRTCST